MSPLTRPTRLYTGSSRRKLTCGSGLAGWDLAASVACVYNVANECEKAGNDKHQQALGRTVIQESNERLQRPEKSQQCPDHPAAHTKEE